jgi:hypothetical protein
MLNEYMFGWGANWNGPMSLDGVWMLLFTHAIVGQIWIREPSYSPALLSRVSSCANHRQSFTVTTRGDVGHVTILSARAIGNPRADCW